MTAARCQEKTKAGKPCRAYAIKGSKFCQAHDPQLTAQRAAWRRAGGLATRTPEGEAADLISVEDVRRGVAAAIGSTWKLANTAERSRALNSLYSTALRVFEATELEERMADLERRLGSLLQDRSDMRIPGTILAERRTLEDHGEAQFPVS